MSELREVLILEAVRTPIGRIRGNLSNVRPDDMLAAAIRACLDRTGLYAGSVDEVIAGCANQAGEDNRNVARMGLLLAGLPNSVPGFTINRLCASGLAAINTAARQIACGEANVVLAGGVESMSRAPLVVEKGSDGWAGGNRTMYDSSLGWRFPNPRMEALFPLESMGMTAENLVDQMHISREDQDAFAYDSHMKAVRAEDEGRFNDERVPLQVDQRRGEPKVVVKDEGPRPDTSLEKLGRLRPVFKDGGTVTAGNSSSMNDGAACLALATREVAEKAGIRPLARWLGSKSVGVNPRIMGIGPVPAIEALLKRFKLEIEDIDRIELNEAFAAQSLAVLRRLAGDESKIIDRVNVNGGAIALGHPLGASGARITTTLVHEMKRSGAQLGLSALCVGVGQGEATLLEAC